MPGYAPGSLLELLERTAFLDIETRKEDGYVREWGVLHGEQRRREEVKRRHGLEALDECLSGADFIAGHNIIEHDFPLLEKADSGLRLLRKPAIDTLFLSPLAFPANPYHRLVKEYKQVSQSKSDPLEDALLSRRLLEAEWDELSNLGEHSPDVLRLYRHSFEAIEEEKGRWRGMVALFDALGASAMKRHDALATFQKVAQGASRASSGEEGPGSWQACVQATERLVTRLTREPLTTPWLAYVVAWLRVAGGSSVLPTWVHRNMPEVGHHLHELRDVNCGKEDCPWCGEQHDAERRLQAYFGFDAFRATPKDEAGGSLQKAIVEAVSVKVVVA